MEALTIVKSITYFLIADLFEIGGGYLIWLWIREGRPITYPKVEYSEPRILKDTKNILYQNFVERYCKQMQECLTLQRSICQPAYVCPVMNTNITGETRDMLIIEILGQ
jgi:hypothetical protein